MLGSNPIFIVTLVFPKNEEACLFIKTIQQEIHSISFVIIDLSLTQVALHFQDKANVS